jgi:hypothetical protein
MGCATLIGNSTIGEGTIHTQATCGIALARLLTAGLHRRLPSLNGKRSARLRNMRVKSPAGVLSAGVRQIELICISNWVHRSAPYDSNWTLIICIIIHIQRRETRLGGRWAKTCDGLCMLGTGCGPARSLPLGLRQYLGRG